MKIAKAKLKRIAERIARAEQHKIGIIYATHGTLIMQHTASDKRVHEDILFSAIGPTQHAAASLLQSADPETIKELIRGYQLASDARLL